MCRFCEIASGRNPAHVVYEDPTSLAFLDHRPLFVGHCLLIPRAHHETLVDLPAPLIEPLFAAARLLSGAVQVAMQAPGSFVAINNRVSQSVPHLHVHVIPRRPKDGLRGFFWPRTRYDDEQQMEDVAGAIRDVLRELA